MDVGHGQDINVSKGQILKRLQATPGGRDRTGCVFWSTEISIIRTFPTTNGWYAKWKLSRNTYTLRTCFSHIWPPTCMLNRWLLNKIYASELRQKFIKSALLVGLICTYFLKVLACQLFLHLLGHSIWLKKTNDLVNFLKKKPWRFLCTKSTWSVLKISQVYYSSPPPAPTRNLFSSPEVKCAKVATLTTASLSETISVAVCHWDSTMEDEFGLLGTSLFFPPPPPPLPPSIHHSTLHKSQFVCV